MKPSQINSAPTELKRESSGLPLQINCLVSMLLTSLVLLTCVNDTIAQSDQNGNSQGPSLDGSQTTDDKTTSGSSKTKFDPAAAFKHLEAVCEFGKRVSGSPGMIKQQEYLKKHFESLGAEVYFQSFPATNPQNGLKIEMKNQLVRWHPEREKRCLICCHYDTRPFPDRDPVNPRGVFIGANDGGSGVALLCELGKHMSDLPGPLGVDFVFFDGEEYVFVGRRDPMFLGSTHFAKQYAGGRVRANYTAGVLVDMVADKNLELHYEGNSLRHAPRVTRDLWAIAGKLGIKEFVREQRHHIRDDHLPLNRIARIPVCDIIDFDFPKPGNDYWHTEQDVVSNCSADSLGKVGTVVLEWLREMQTRR